MMELRMGRSCDTCMIDWTYCHKQLAWFWLEQCHEILREDIAICCEIIDFCDLVM